VLVHGWPTEERRVSSQDVLLALGVPELTAIEQIAPGSVAYAPAALLLPGLARLLDVRRVLGLRNSAHSLVKQMNPLAPVGARALIVGSYTHPEYAASMAATAALTGADALLLRGTEGEPVADPRRTPQMDGFLAGQPLRLQEAQGGPLAQLPALPAPDAASTATYIRAVLAGELPVPEPMAQQVEHIVHLVRQIPA
jgi:anthranilate phosphoribosyltransferase